jgi:AmmeMemoRadiSam system protein B
VAPGARVVPLAVSTGTGVSAIEAGRTLGALLAARSATGERLLLVASSDAAHYPDAREAEHVNEHLLAPLRAVDADALAVVSDEIQAAGGPGLVCAMCGIEPTVVLLAALSAMGARAGECLMAATSADAGGGTERTVGYLAVAFTG